MATRIGAALRRVGNTATTSLAIVGFVTIAAAAKQAKDARDVEADSAASSFSSDGVPLAKQVLVVPFHRLRLVEKKEGGFRQAVEGLQLRGQSDDETKIIEMSLKELVDTIHAAAEDPKIVALYGIFGHGNQFQSMGFAQVEEIRNALKVFRECHRVHLEPNVEHERVLERSGNGTPKPMYAYADSFVNTRGGNAEYYLASVFSHVHMQKQGELDLLGLASSQPFLKSFLDKYGIKMHVFRRGKYKNATNMFSETKYTKEHRESMEMLLESLDEQMCDNIGSSRSQRSKQRFDPALWKVIREWGTLNAVEAQKLGFIDYIATLDPLGDLLKSNKTIKGDEEKLSEIEAEKELLKKKWGGQTDMDKFDATESISLTKYAAKLKKRKDVEQRKLKRLKKLKELAEKSSAFDSMTKMVGLTNDESATKVAAASEKIAVVHMTGTVGNNMALKSVAALRKIKEDDDIKCVVVRVSSPGGSPTSSETILRELKDMSKPVVCSMGDICASGGYYIAAGADRVFALPSTITGSIGVFGIKLDLTGFAKRYGVRFDRIETGPHAGALDSSQPLTKAMEANINRRIDSVYDAFKEVVSDGRGMTLEEVEAVAGGRVWTGEQAKAVGLVDELGGLSRAVAYAKRTYTTSGEDAALEVWPKETSFLEKFGKAMNEDKASAFLLSLMYGSLWSVFSGKNDNHSEFPLHYSTWQTAAHAGSLLTPPSMSGVVMTMDELSAVDHLLQQQLQAQQSKPDDITVTDLVLDDIWR